VLRGPAAAIWGGRAANGVILITTRGGRGLSGFEVSASQNASSESPLRLPAFQNAYGQGLNGQFSFFDGLGGGTNDGVAQNWGPALQGQALTQASLTVPRPETVPQLARPAVPFFWWYDVDDHRVGNSGRGETIASLDRRAPAGSFRVRCAAGRGASLARPTSRRRSRWKRTYR
jgi:TonB-dependent SusC/RagA subfamily outer membrane receptor